MMLKMSGRIAGGKTVSKFGPTVLKPGGTKESLEL